MNRAADIALTVAGLPAVLPFGAAAACALYVADGRPLLFVQERVGLRRRPFRIVKLRTMRHGRVTPVGRFLRDTGLDELPQLVNVIRGEMSLVGPRPLTHGDVVRLGWEDPRYDGRWSVRPGIIGPAQLHSTLRCSARITWVYDRAYVRRASLWRDLGLLASVPLCALFGKRRTARLVQRLLGRTR